MPAKIAPGRTTRAARTGPGSDWDRRARRALPGEPLAEELLRERRVRGAPRPSSPARRGSRARPRSRRGTSPPRPRSRRGPGRRGRRAPTRPRPAGGRAAPRCPRSGRRSGTPPRAPAWPRARIVPSATSATRSATCRAVTSWALAGRVGHDDLVLQPREVLRDPVGRRGRLGAERHRLLEQRRRLTVAHQDARDLGLQPERLDVAGAPGARQLGESRGSPRPTGRPARAPGCPAPGSTGSRSLLLGAHRLRRPGVLVPVPRLLDERIAGLQRGDLTVDLERQGALQRPDRVHVLDLDLHAERVGSGRIETFASQRSDPSSIRTSDTSRASSSARSSRR